MKTLDLRKDRSTIHIDTYVFSGKYDAQCPLEFSYEIANLIPTSKLTVFEQSNHNPFVEEEEMFEDFVKKTTI